MAFKQHHMPVTAQHTRRVTCSGNKSDSLVFYEAELSQVESQAPSSAGSWWELVLPAPALLRAAVSGLPASPAAGAGLAGGAVALGTSRGSRSCLCSAGNSLQDQHCPGKGTRLQTAGKKELLDVLYGKYRPVCALGACGTSIVLLPMSVLGLAIPKPFYVPASPT